MVHFTEPLLCAVNATQVQLGCEPRGLPAALKDPFPGVLSRKMGGSLPAHLHAFGLRAKQQEEREQRLDSQGRLSWGLARKQAFPLNAGCLKSPTGTGSTTECKSVMGAALRVGERW